MTLPAETNVLVVGAGPAGLITALQLARHGISCTLVERNHDTTKWPKMDITNCRSMELFNRLGISQGLRSIGVPQNYSFNVLFSTGLSDNGQLISKWDLPSPDAWRDRMKTQNDGSMPREPYQRCSQAIFEAWLKPHIQEQPLISSHFGVKLENLVEDEDGVLSYVVDLKTDEQHKIRSKFVVGCDGAGSRVRKSLNIELIGGPVPGAMLLVHFKSQDLTKLHKQGQFWHIFFTSGGVIISQDEVDTWTTHLPIPLDADWQSMDPTEAIHKVLGGSCGPFPIDINEIMVKSVWRPNICIAEKYTSKRRRVFLSGDAAHQNIPTGGYGMNTAVGDSFDIGWKLAAVLKGYGGPSLLESYEIERKPVAVRNIDRSGEHHMVHMTYVDMVMRAEPDLVVSSSDAGAALRQTIEEQTTAKDGENKDHGIEMGYRYNGSPVVIPDLEEQEPGWNERDYIPSTWPGARPPHVFLRDGKTSIFDLFGPDYTIIDFTQEGAIASTFMQTATKLGIPLKSVHLPTEAHVYKVWNRRAVLLRPDDHVAWRAAADITKSIDVENVLKIASGQQYSSMNGQMEDVVDHIKTNGFSGTVGIQKHDEIQSLGEFQK